MTKNLKQESMRDGFGRGLLRAAQLDKNIVVVCADLASSTKVEEFAMEFPERFVEVGVAEQNLVTLSSGLAAAGKNVFATSYAVFSPGRNWEQIRTTICYNNQPVKIIGSHAGISTGADGATHQALEDIALMRVLPNMVVISPCDSFEAEKATMDIAKLNKPCYLRLLRDASPIITTDKTPFKIGQGDILVDPSTLQQVQGRTEQSRSAASSGHFADATIIATGQMVYQALKAAQELAMSNISVRVINIHTIKPLDTKLVLVAAEQTGAIVTVEEHQIAGGLGSAVSEAVSRHFPVPIEMVGIQDRFGESGEGDELLVKYGLTSAEIVKKVISVLRKKEKKY